ncbi:MAG: hypothetical protein QG608_428 [Actinomycetota bacterium]|nr:hypothetical protein [Actinomycetota bacterium]
MRRLFWVALGAVAGVVIAGRITRAARECTPTGVARTAVDLVASVRRDMAARERELRQEFGMDESPSPEEGPGTVAARG